MTTRRTVLKSAPVLLLSAAPAWAQSFPTKPIRYIVPVPAGGGSDFAARLIGQSLSHKAGQPVIVLRKSAGGHPESFTIATDRAGRSPQIVLSGSTDRGLKRAVQKLILKSNQTIL
jgi:tripartite-type tricarboxylate transporter receptor subunit TctC